MTWLCNTDLGRGKKKNNQKSIKTKQKPNEAGCCLMMANQKDCFLHDLSTSSGGRFQKRRVGILNNIIIVGLSAWSPKVTGSKRNSSF